MTDREALLAAICAHPDEDTPRLIYADWLEENDEAVRAAFIRKQVELARLPPWEPESAACRWQQPELAFGTHFRAALPQADGYHVCWAPMPFRRGFGWSLLVRTASLWREQAVPLFDREPIGKVAFWQGTLDDWMQIAASACVKSFRELVLNSNPIEPLYALRDVPAACGITDVHFARASGAGMPVVVEDLLRSPLGRAVSGLHFQVGYESLHAILDALNTGHSLTRLSFSLMGISAEELRRLFDGPAAAALTEFHLRDELVESEGMAVLAEKVPPGVLDLTLGNVGLRADGIEALQRSANLESVRRLNLNRNPLTPRAARLLGQSHVLEGLRSLDLSGCVMGDKGVRHITRARFWLNLVELDLRQNSISAAGIRHLLDAPLPPQLAALILDGDSLGTESRRLLTLKFGPAVIFAMGELQA